MNKPSPAVQSVVQPLRLGPARVIVAMVIWIALTVGIGVALGDGEQHPLAYAATQQIGWHWLAAAAFAGTVAWRAGADAMGLRSPFPTSSIMLVWLPLAYVGIMLAVDVLLGLPSPSVTAILAVNMLLVGLSEELMFRSIVFHGLITRYPIWPAVLLTSFLFGLVHSLNVFATGQMVQALLQSATAFMQGIAYMAIRIRTRSVWPMVIVHALWDFSLILSVATRPSVGAGDGAGFYWAPLLVAMPVFLYGLFLLRHLDRDHADWLGFRPKPTESAKGTE